MRLLAKIGHQVIPHFELDSQQDEDQSIVTGHSVISISEYLVSLLEKVKYSCHRYKHLNSLLPLFNLPEDLQFRSLVDPVLNPVTHERLYFFPFLDL